MRQPLSRYDHLLRFLGFLAKMLFTTMFICTVLVVLAALFGVGALVLQIYLVIWAIYWRVAITILAIMAIVTMLDGLQ